MKRLTFLLVLSISIVFFPAPRLDTPVTWQTLKVGKHIDRSAQVHRLPIPSEHPCAEALYEQSAGDPFIPWECHSSNQVFVRCSLWPETPYCP